MNIADPHYPEPGDLFWNANHSRQYVTAVGEDNLLSRDEGHKNGDVWQETCTPLSQVAACWQPYEGDVG